MGRSLCPDRARASMAVGAAIVASLIPGALAQIAVITAGGIIGGLWLVPRSSLPHSPTPFKLTKRFGVSALALFLILLLLSPLAARESGLYVVQLFDSFFRAGALVFGGGHVVLPLLQAQLVPRGWLSNDAFLAGYGAAQAVPGPLFTIAAYLGAASSQTPNGWVGAVVALVAHISSRIPVGDRRPAAVGRGASPSGLSEHRAGRERIGRRAVACCVLSTSLGQRDFIRRRFHAGGDRISVACVLEYAALAGGAPVRGGRWPWLGLNFKERRRRRGGAEGSRRGFSRAPRPDSASRRLGLRSR